MVNHSTSVQHGVLCTVSHSSSRRNDPTTPYIDVILHRMLIGKLRFLTKIIPEFTHVVSVVSNFMQNLLGYALASYEEHFALLSLASVSKLRFVLCPRGENYLHSYTDADYGQDVYDRILFEAYIFFHRRTPISWNSKKQSSALDHLVSLSRKLGSMLMWRHVD